MSVAAYMKLRSEMAQVRSREDDGDDEARLVGEMDDVWWNLTSKEQATVRAAILAERRAQMVVPSVQVDLMFVVFGKVMAIKPSSTVPVPVREVSDLLAFGTVASVHGRSLLATASA
jgi:hypothetical protein